MPINEQAEFAALANRVGPLATPIKVRRGAYWRWCSDCGAELWLQTNAENELVGMTPFFCGNGKIRVRVTAHLCDKHYAGLDGSFHGWADPDVGHAESGAYPFVFDVVDYHRHAMLKLPTTVEAQIAAFAHEVNVFPSLDAYRASQTGELQFASQSFIPSGLFSAAGELTAPPQAHAIFTGHVLAASIKTNSLTNERYYWAHVDTLGGSFDVVIDPAICAAVPERGGVLSGSFWLCGRILT